MSNRIIVPVVYDFEVMIKVSTRTGQSEMRIRNRSNKQITMWQVAGLLVEHASTTMKSLLTTGKVIQTPFTTEEEQKEVINDQQAGGENAS